MLLTDQRCIGRQLDFHKSQARGRLIKAGNRAGKTEAGAREAAFYATGAHPFRSDVRVPSIGWCVTLDRDLHLSVIRPKFLKYIPASMIARTVDGDVPQAFLTNGTIIRFKSVASGWEKFQSADVDWIWFDEGIPKEVFKECRIRLIDRKGPWWMTYTPVAGVDWVYYELYEPWTEGTVDPRKFDCFEWSSDENTTLPPEEVQETFGEMSQDEQRVRRHGDFVQRSGLILTEFDESVHVVPVEPLMDWWPLGGGLDQGTGHPFGACLCAVDDEGGIVVWSTYRRSRGLLSDHALAIAKLFRERAPWAVNENVWQRVFREEGHQKARAGEHLLESTDWWIDPSAAQTKLELEPFGIFAANADREYDGGIERLNQLFRDRKMGRPGIRFFQGHTNDFIREARVYSWKPRPEGSDAKPQPIKKNDDVIDAARYFCKSRPAGAAPPAARPPAPGSFAYEDELLDYTDRVKKRIGNDRVAGHRLEAYVARMGRAF